MADWMLDEFESCLVAAGDPSPDGPNTHQRDADRLRVRLLRRLKLTKAERAVVEAAKALIAEHNTGSGDAESLFDTLDLRVSELERARRKA